MLYILLCQKTNRLENSFSDCLLFAQDLPRDVISFQVLINPYLNLPIESDHTFIKTNTSGPHFFEYCLMPFEQILADVQHFFLAKLLEVAQMALNGLRFDRIMGT